MKAKFRTFKPFLYVIFSVTLLGLLEVSANVNYGFYTSRFHCYASTKSQLKLNQQARHVFVAFTKIFSFNRAIDVKDTSVTEKKLGILESVSDYVFADDLLFDGGLMKAVTKEGFVKAAKVGLYPAFAKSSINAVVYSDIEIENTIALEKNNGYEAFVSATTTQRLADGAKNVQHWVYHFTTNKKNQIVKMKISEVTLPTQDGLCKTTGVIEC